MNAGKLLKPIAITAKTTEGSRRCKEKLHKFSELIDHPPAHRVDGA
jgi:hypothetical protein